MLGTSSVRLPFGITVQLENDLKTPPMHFATGNEPSNDTTPIAHILMRRILETSTNLGQKKRQLTNLEMEASLLPLYLIYHCTSFQGPSLPESPIFLKVMDQSRGFSTDWR